MKFGGIGALSERGSQFIRDIVVAGAFSQVAMNRTRGLRGFHLRTRSTRPEELFQLPDSDTTDKAVA